MSFTKIQKILTKKEILSLLPLNNKLKKIKEENDKKIKNIINGEDDRYLVIVGPCSAHDEKAVLQYVQMLCEIGQKTEDKILLVPRIYTGKPRTTGEGYKGMVHQKNMYSTPSVKEGIIAMRKLQLKVLKEYHMPIADEMLYTSVYPFVQDLISYVAIGARNVYSQEHKLISSGIDSALGMKNPMCGNILAMINAIHTAQGSHNFMYEGYEVDTSGNAYAHGILRGYIDDDNNNYENYSYNNLEKIVNMYGGTGLLNKSLIIDANHSNSGKCFYKQPYIVKDVLKSLKKDKKIRKIVKGFMIESYIEEGADTTKNIFGKSITDPCLSFKDTEKLLYDIATFL